MSSQADMLARALSSDRPAREPGIPAGMKAVAEKTERLEARVAELRHKLFLVSRPEAPATAVGQKLRQPGDASPLNAEIHEIAQRLDALAGALGDTIVRLEL